ncbi:MAG: hypothetical protein FWH26_00715 [Oscillospiraceae bacterium]|nr:hypothetical protein [Oscillospiraceae bacterium]
MRKAAEPANSNLEGTGKSLSYYRHTLARRLRELRGQYRRALGQGLALSRRRETGTAGIYREWLRDNYYMLEREGHAVLRELRQQSRRQGPEGRAAFARMRAFCRAVCQRGMLPGQEVLLRELRRANPTAAEAEWFHLALRYALVEYAAESGRQWEEEWRAALISGAVRSFRALPDLDLSALLEEVNPLERQLRKDPAGIYPRMEEGSRAVLRSLLVRQSRREKRPAEETARLLARDCAGKRDGDPERHIGLPLLARAYAKKRGMALLWTESLLPAVLALAAAAALGAWYLLPLLYLPLWAVCRAPLEAVFLRGTDTVPLPRLELGGQVTAEGRTLITVSTLLPGAAKAAQLRRRMEELHGSNGGANVTICVLADLKGAACAVMPQDDADIAAARREVEALNHRYGGGFLLAVRPRVYSPTMRQYTGWERKRGALLQLAGRLREEASSDSDFLCLYGDTRYLRDYKYILALDADTRLPLDTVAEMVSAALHPCNRPVFDPGLGRIVRGYGVLAPYVGVELESTRATPFAHAMAGEGGISPYANHVSERYQDLFGRGIFAGKGLIDIEAFLAVSRARPFPEERVLSHDILEGGYLRAGFLADVQVTDGFPAKQASYFTRQERWVRGDWQNLCFLSKKLGLDFLCRYQLFDNLRRSLLGPGCLLAALASMAAHSFPASATLLLAAVLGVSGSYFVSAARSLASGGMAMLSRLYYAGGFPAALGDLTRGVLQVIVLAQTAWVNTAAAARGFWRGCVSHEKRLEWTTAAQGEAARSRVWPALWPSAAAGILLLVFGQAGQRLLGLFLLSNLLFAPLSARPSSRAQKPLEESERERVTGYCAAMWKYFETYCSEEHNYLPPDNVQETPVFRVAPRSSPTNIGLYLLCILAARDLGFISAEGMCQRLSRSLGAVERLERWHGNLLNWYDIRTLRPLEPRYVSTVDSGNLLCCMTALREGLREYQSEHGEVKPIMGRVQRLIDGCDLRPLYHARRKLFHIGIELSPGQTGEAGKELNPGQTGEAGKELNPGQTGEASKVSASYYDLLMSEARMTGYYAIAARMAPKKHWGALGRTLARAGRFTGPVSWTGTMFEYFMPYLFLPAPKGTLGYEALRFCLSCQKRRVPIARQGQGKLPWGCSESGFYAFDANLNYQYKAHGVQKLGLRRGLEEELVLAPYASFLAMQLAPRSALENLRRFERMGMAGHCGFYEAVDATPRRAGGQDYAVVRSYMAHHVGMSLLAALNSLREGILRERFLADKRMASAQSLLEERIPDRAAVFRDVELRDTPRHRERITAARAVFEAADAAMPRAQLLTNGEWSCVMTDTGAGVSFYRGASILRHSPDLLRRPCGVRLLCLPSEGSAAPQKMEKTEFGNRDVLYAWESGPVRASMRTAVHPRLPAEERRIWIKNAGRQMAQGKLLLYLEPSLAPMREEAAHPAFSKLFLADSCDTAQEIVTFSRSRLDDRGGGVEALCLAVGLSRGVSAFCERDRERAFKIMEGEGQAGRGTARGNPDACALFELPYQLQPGESMEFSLFLCAGSTGEEAAGRLSQLRDERVSAKIAQGAPSPFREGEMAAALARRILPRLLFYAAASQQSLEARARLRAKKQALWPAGVSGDFPFIYIPLDSPEEILGALPYVGMFRKFHGAGIPCELALGFREGGDYDTPFSTALRAAVCREGCGHLVNQRGGVQLVNLNRVPSDTAMALEAYAAHLASEKAPRESGQSRPAGALPILAANPGAAKGGADAGIYAGAGIFTEGGFRVPKQDKSPAVPWCLPLCNPSFGTIVSESALGFTWAVNSRENRLSPWYNDTCTDNRGELLLLRFGSRVYDLLLGARCEFTPGEARWTGELHGIAYEVTVYVAARGCTKRCELRLRNTTDRGLAPELAYYLEPVLGERREPGAVIQGEALPDGALLRSPSSCVAGWCALLLTGSADFVCASRPDFLRGLWRTDAGWPQSDPCAAVGRKLSLPPGGEAVAEFSLSWGARRNAALCAHLVAERDAPAGPALRVDTPSEALNHMMNTWLPHQILHSRLYGRAGFYQCGGAWGFRDQLQDVSALTLTHPQLLRIQLARCAAAQFPEGDALHWWHRIPGEGLRGVRTRYADDYLWLPYVCAEYVEQSGDAAFLDTQIPFRRGAPLAPNEKERYAVYPRTAERASLYEHCLRAADRALGLLGARGLPLIGGGDWNDGFSFLGAKGRGESVWLAQFLVMVLEKTAGLCARREENARAELYRHQAALLRLNVDFHAWDKDRYFRAFCDDGAPLGSRSENGACAIDSLPQSFAVLCGMPDARRRGLALDTAISQLADSRHGVVRLLREPFALHGRRAGYINAYPPGIRENGGQYTHAAAWLCLALFRENRPDDAWRLLQMLNPAAFCQEPARMERYRAEPYALAGDVAAAPGVEGRAGWTHYTGGAAWFYRAVLEGMLGLRMRGGALAWEPCLPKGWKDVKVTLRRKEGEDRKEGEEVIILDQNAK